LGSGLKEIDEATLD